ncbi:MAG: alpha/beta hydrolase [Clostridia bacterium]|nr:alpha/beta hydrolase [Clostridia bacterium]
MNKSTKRLIIGAGLAAAAAAGFGAARAAIQTMIDEALDRREPPVMSRARTKISGSPKVAKIVEDAEAKSAILRSRETETVEIESFDGTRLTGHIYRAAETKRYIVAMHGWRSSWTRDFGAVSDFWHDNGCTVLYAEQRGQGDSDGEYMGFGMIERFDCLEWAKWLNEKEAEEKPLYLAGLSMGASTVLMASGSSELPPNVRGIMADCGFTSAKAIWKHVAEKNLRVSYDLLQKPIEEFCRCRIDMEPDAYSTLDAMETNKTPILFVHGSADSFVPVEMTCENYGACRAPKHLLIVNGAEHGMSYIVDKEAYEKAVLDFWAEFDSPAAEEQKKEEE